VCRFLFLFRQPIQPHSRSCPATQPDADKLLEDTMALAMVAEIPRLSREAYEQVVRKVNESGSPAGALFHAGGPIEGGYRVVEVWHSREAADAFYNSPLYREATADLDTEPEIRLTWSIQGLDNGSGWRAAD
jgi:quinol monooxygenase YgiN